MTGAESLRTLTTWRCTPYGNTQARSQDFEMGGSFSVSADRRPSVCDPNFPAGGLGAL